VQHGQVYCATGRLRREFSGNSSYVFFFNSSPPTGMPYVLRLTLFLFFSLSVRFSIWANPHVAATTSTVHRDKSAA
jgi:hypothetical protein